MVLVTHDPIDPAMSYDSISSAFSGSVVFHYAVVKQKTGSDILTTSVEYKAKENAIEEMEGIVRELKTRWELEDMLMIRRTGCLAVGEIISLVAASSPNSEDAFEACKCGISQLKKMVTISKIENYLAESTQKEGYL
jgi:molybdopterin synthase catalytic subunit